MKFINDPMSDDGDDALRCIINVPNRYIGRRFINELEEFSNQRNVRLYQGLKSMRIKIPYVRQNVRKFIQLIDPLIREARN